MGQTEDVTLPDFCSKPWIINFNETEGETQTFISPFDGSYLEAGLPMVEGKQCLECLGDWLLMFDEGTRECFLSNITSHSKISLPPLLEPLESLNRCALSSPTPPDCTIMFASNGGTFVLYCRPGDKEWTKYHVDLENDNFVGTIFGCKGKMYVQITNSCVVINTTSSNVHVEKMGVAAEPNTYPLSQPNHSCWVESNGDIFLVRLYLHCYHSLVNGVTNVDVHRMDTLEYVWKKVESIGDATFFLGSNCVALPSTVAGTQRDCIHCLRFSCDGIRLYTIRLDARTISFSLLPACACTAESSSGAYWIHYWSALYWAIPQR